MNVFERLHVLVQKPVFVHVELHVYTCMQSQQVGIHILVLSISVFDTGFFTETGTHDSARLGGQ